MTEVEAGQLTAAREFARVVNERLASTSGLDGPIDDSGKSGRAMVEAFAHAADPADSNWSELQSHLGHASPAAVAEQLIGHALASVAQYREVVEARDQTGSVEPIAVTDANFDALVLKAELPVVVDYWAPWCAPCRMIAPMLEVLAAELEGRISFAKVNVEENEGRARHGMTTLNLQGIPTLVLYRNGQVTGHMQGAAGLDAIRQFISTGLSEPAEA